MIYDQYSDVITITCFADKDKPYEGYSLLQTLLAIGFRFGKYKIFHYEELDKSLFSLASVIKPGVFNMDSMGEFSTPGLSIFMRLEFDEHIEIRFDKMLQTAKLITKELGGYLVDEQHQELTDSRIQQMRMWLRKYQRDTMGEGADEYSE